MLLTLRRNWKDRFKIYCTLIYLQLPLYKECEIETEVARRILFVAICFMCSELSWWEKTIYKNTEFVELKIYWLATTLGVEANLFQLCFIGGKRWLYPSESGKHKTKLQPSKLQTTVLPWVMGIIRFKSLLNCLGISNECVMIISRWWNLAGDNNWAIM